MSFLLASDACLSIMRLHRRVSARYAQQMGHVHLSVVSITELALWLIRSPSPGKHTQALSALIRSGTLIEVDESIARRGGLIGLTLHAQRPRPTLSHLIVAATALDRGLTLVTHHPSRYAGIQGLTAIDWAAP
jgi:predicted nucleic acid-binding protein